MIIRSFLVLTLCLSSAWAAEETHLGVLRRASPVQGDAVTLGLQVNQFDYGEFRGASAKTLDTENGLMAGIRMGYEHRFRSTRWFVGSNLSAAFGTSLYEGGTWNPASGGGQIQSLSAQTTNSMVNLELLGGGDLLYGASLGLSPYAGIGMNYWQRDMSATPSGYIEHYVWFYLPVGVRVKERLGRRLQLTEDASLRWNMGGAIDADFPNHPQMAPAGGSLGMALGCRAELSLIYLVHEGFRIIASPFFEYLPIGMGGTFAMTTWSGKVITALAHEPDSHSYRYGLVTGIQILL